MRVRSSLSGYPMLPKQSHPPNVSNEMQKGKHKHGCVGNNLVCTLYFGKGGVSVFFLTTFFGGVLGPLRLDFLLPVVFLEDDLLRFFLEPVKDETPFHFSSTDVQHTGQYRSRASVCECVCVRVCVCVRE